MVLNGGVKFPAAFHSTNLPLIPHTLALYYIYIYIYIGHFKMFSMITNIYNKKTKGPTLMELFTATGKLKKVSF